MSMRSSEDPQNATPRRLAILLIVIGLLLAVDSFLELSIVYRFWPLLLTMFAIGLIGIFVRGGARESLFLAAGVYLACFSVLALYCNFASWSALGRLWPLFVAFLGAVFAALFRFQGKRRVHLLLGLLLFSVAAVFFVVFTLGGRFWWTIFILVGLSVLASERAR